MSFISLSLSAQETVGDQDQARQSRVDTAENSARQATYSFQYTTTGVGHLVVEAPVYFPCTFTARPTVSYAPVLAQAPDVGHYRYPLANGGVWKWITQPKPSGEQLARSSTTTLDFISFGAASDTSGALDEPPIDALYLGCYLYFVVVIDPLRRPRTDGSNLADLQHTLTTQTAGTDAYRATQGLIAEAKEAIYLTAHPPIAVVHHDMRFEGIALKGLPSNVIDEMHNNPAIEPLQVPFGSADASAPDSPATGTVNTTGDSLDVGSQDDDG